MAEAPKKQSTTGQEAYGPYRRTVPTNCSQLAYAVLGQLIGSERTPGKRPSPGQGREDCLGHLMVLFVLPLSSSKILYCPDSVNDVRYHAT